MKEISENKNLPTLYGTSPSSDLPALAAGLIHEVKNPLAAVHLHLQLLQEYLSEVEENAIREKLEAKVTLIKNEIQNLNQTLHSFFTLLKPNLHKKNKAFDLGIVIEDVIHLLEPQTEKKGISIDFHHAKIDKVYHLDLSFIRQIILNLLLNAIQSFENLQDPKRKKWIRIMTGKKKGWIYIEISDNGTGISEAVQERMFEPFYSTKKEKGSGLGLTLVQKMLTSMGGRLEVQSKMEQGTSFLILFYANETGTKKIPKPSREDHVSK